MNEAPLYRTLDANEAVADVAYRLSEVIARTIFAARVLQRETYAIDCRRSACAGAILASPVNHVQ
jgi:hypothetical protein